MSNLKVLSYNANERYHECQDIGQDKLRRIDLITSGCLPVNIDPESLVGKYIQTSYEHPYLEMAEGVVVLETSSDTT